ncbi:MAG: acylphosphatase [Candidatus Brocadiia bacterium]
MNGMKSQAHLYISGLVQGVFFRASAKEMAQSLGLSGWVKNMADRRVEAIFVGNKNDIKKAIEWCHHGPPSARVDKVEVIWEEPLALPQE